MPYKIAGIDVHKRMLHVVVSDVEVDGEYDFTRRIFGSSPEALRSLAAWLIEEQVEEVVMESTAQYWQPVWGALERCWKPICQTREGALARSGTLHLAQALSNRGRRGRKKDFRDAERLVKRLVAHELTLSFVPDVEQRLWRTIIRTKYQLTRNRVQLQNRLEALLEEAHIKLSSLVSDLLGASARRILEAPRLGHNQTIGIIAHKLCRLIWKILHQGIRYEERGPEVNKASKHRRTQKMIRELRRLGYRIELSPSHLARLSTLRRLFGKWQSSRAVTENLVLPESSGCWPRLAAIAGPS
jgi:transposase